MSPARQRKAAAKMLGIAIHQRYENLVNATGEDAITIATVDMAQVMYDNAEFIIWALKTLGGLNPPLPDRINPIPLNRPKPPEPANDLPVLPAALIGEQQLPPELAKCTCEVLEAGIIGRDKHMASCPQFEPV